MTQLLFFSCSPLPLLCLVLLFLSCAWCCQVYSIREAAATNLKRLAEEFGAEWAQTQIVPLVCAALHHLSVPRDFVPLVCAALYHLTEPW